MAADGQARRPRLVTYRGEGFLAKAESRGRAPTAGADRGTLGRGGFGFTATDFWEGVFPAFYGGAYHRDSYVREHWGRFFEVEDLLPATQTGLVQDLAVMRRAYAARGTLATMGKRQRRRTRRDPAADPVPSVSDYSDPEGNVLTLRDSLSPATVRKLTRPGRLGCRHR